MGHFLWISLLVIALINYSIIKFFQNNGTLTQRIKNPAFGEIVWALISPIALTISWFVSAMEGSTWGSGDWLTPAIVLATIWVAFTKFLLNKTFVGSFVLVVYSCIPLAGAFAVGMLFGQMKFK